MAAAGTGIVTDPAWPQIRIHSLAEAILHTVVYADLFDYPLTGEEIHRFLAGYSASLAAVEEHLAHHDRLTGTLGSVAPFWFLAGREYLVELRQERKAYAETLWREAGRYGHLMSGLPFVRMVAITGSLSVNNVTSAHDDVDLLIVAARQRVWLARGLAILVVHLAQRRNIELCPNYVLSEDHLRLDEIGFFAAHELAQTVPLSGFDIYVQLLQSNSWLDQYLPNASPRQSQPREMGAMTRAAKALLEGALGGRLGDAVERWERERKIPRLQRVAELRGAKGAVYTPHLCKGHVDDHGTSIQQQYVARLAAHGL
jgi:hypothetical protein